MNGQSSGQNTGSDLVFESSGLLEDSARSTRVSVQCRSISYRWQARSFGPRTRTDGRGAYNRTALEPKGDHGCAWVSETG